jgi:molybdate transport system substrate-binding protein
VSPARILLAFALLFGALPAAVQAAEFRVAVASNFRGAAREITAGFEAASGHRAVLIFGSTGKHYAQIVNGAPFEVFLAADAARPERLERSGHAVPGTRFTYALGRLALWSADAERVVDGAALLQQGDFRCLAIANPRLAPYGTAAQQVLEARGLWADLQPRLATAENVAQAYQFVASGNAEVGLVAWPLLLQGEAGPTGSWWRVPETLHAPIAQQAVLLRENPGGRAFLAYLRGAEALAILRARGYGVPDDF